MTKFNSGKWIKEHKNAKLNEANFKPGDRFGGRDVDHTTMKLKSNIDQKWRSVEDMRSDLVQWIQASVAASGTEMLEDIEEEYDLIGKEILKLYKSVDSRSYR